MRRLTTDDSAATVWLLTNAPSPYQVELLNAVSDRTDVRVNARFMRDSSCPGPERRFPHRVCRSWLAITKGDELRLHGLPLREAAFGHADLYILSGLYTSVTLLVCAWLLNCRRKTWALWWERPHARNSLAQQMGWPERCLHRFKDSIRNWLLRSAKIVIGIGSIAVNEYETLGVPPSRMRMLPYCIDGSRFSQVSADRRDRLRLEFGGNNPLVFLFSGQMIPRKGVDVLLAAFIQLAAKSPDVVLLLLGDGSQRMSLESQIPETLRDRIHFLGHIPYPRLPEYFAAADVFAFPSRHDGWAVVLNEACAAGLPIIATHQTGAAYDLVVDGENGFRIEADDADALFAAMEWCATHRDRLPAMGQRSRELVEPLDAIRGAETLAQLVQDGLDAE